MLLARAHDLDVEGVMVPMICVEDLIALKVLAGRRKDLEDVRGVLAAQSGKIDFERTRAMLGVFEQAIEGRQNLLARLDRVLRGTRAGASNKRAKPAAKK